MDKKTRITMEIFLYLVIICVMLFLSLRIYLNSRALSCDKCIIDFKSKRSFMDEYTSVKIQAKELYDAFQEGKCLIIWDRTEGYMKNG